MEEIYNISSFCAKKSKEGDKERCSLIVEEPTFFNQDKPDYLYSNGVKVLQRVKMVRDGELNLFFKQLKYAMKSKNSLDSGRVNSIQLNLYLKNGKVLKGMGPHKDTFDGFEIDYPIFIFNFSDKIFKFSEAEFNHKTTWIHEEIHVPPNSLTRMNEPFYHSVKDNNNISTKMLPPGRSLVVRKFYKAKTNQKSKKEKLMKVD
jgi:hypothetical protein